MNTLGIKWDLTDLYNGPHDPTIESDLNDVAERANKLAHLHKGKISAHEPFLILEILNSIEAAQEDLGRIEAFSDLSFAADTEGSPTRALYQKILERGSKIRSTLLFFQLEWCALSNPEVVTLLTNPELKPRRHYLECLRKYAPHCLSEKEEVLLEISANTSRRAFLRLFDETLASMAFCAPPGSECLEMNEEEILSLTYHSNRDTRQLAALNFTEGLKENSHVLTFTLNTLLLEKSECDKIRSYAEPISERNISNEISGDVVETLLQSCETRYDLVQRYYTLKQHLLGLDELKDYDRYAPINIEERTTDFESSKNLVLSAYADFSSEMAEVADKFFENNWIDAEVRKGKRGGAFSASTIPSVHPYIFMSFTGDARDVMTLAHELGHGIHQYLAREKGYFEQNSPLTTAETASVFGEMLVFRKLIREESDPRRQLSLICGKLEDCFATVFRQVMMTRFEQQLHEDRKNHGELTTQRINDIWIEHNSKMFANSVSLDAHYAYWWMYIPHFFHSPFYCYAYAFGELLVFSLLKQYDREGAEFIPKYLELLRAGGSESPEVLLSRMDIDISDAEFWSNGIILIEDLLTAAEALALEVTT